MGIGGSSSTVLTASAGTTPDPTAGPSPSPGGSSSGSGSSSSGSGKSSGSSGSSGSSSGSKPGTGSGGSAATGPGKSSAPTQVPPANPNGSADGAGSGSVAWYDIPGQVEQAIDTWFGDLVKSALTPVLTLLGELVLATPNLLGGRVSQIWEVTLGIADAVFGLFVVIGGIVVMTHDSVQTRYGLKQILPRLFFGFIAANTSLLLINQVLSFGNAITLAVWSTPVSGAGIGNQLLGYIMSSIFLPDGVTQIFMILFGLVLAVLALAVLFSFALRTAGLLLLTVLAPLMLLCHALPGLDAAAQLWWRALGAILAIQILQATVLMLMLQVFFDPDSNVLGVPTAAGLVDLLVCGALFVILLKIPNWVMRMLLGRAPRSTAMSLLRTAAVAAVGTAIGVPGIGSTRMLASRLVGKAASSRLGTGPAQIRSVGQVRLARPPRVGAAKPNFGTAHGRPTASGQGVLFPLPPGARTKPTAVSVPPDSSSEPASAASAGWVQAPLFADPDRFGSAHGRPGPGGQKALFPIPHGARRPARASGSPASAPAAGLEHAPDSGRGWVQPGLFPAAAPGPIWGRQPALFPVPDGTQRARPTARPAPTPKPIPAASPGPRFVQPGLFPPDGRLPAPPVPRSAGTAPRVAGRVPPAPPEPVARMVPVRMTAPAPPGRGRKRGRPKGGA